VTRYKILEVSDKKFTILLDGKVEGHTLSIENALHCVWVSAGSDIKKRFSAVKDDSNGNLYSIEQTKIGE